MSAFIWRLDALTYRTRMLPRRIWSWFANARAINLIHRSSVDYKVHTRDMVEFEYTVYLFGFWLYGSGKGHTLWQAATRAKRNLDRKAAKPGGPRRVRFL